MTGLVRYPAPISAVSDLNDLTDVIISTPEEFQVLEYNGTNWVNTHASSSVYVRNAESTTLTTGTVVYLFGATGDHATVKRADNDSDATSSKTVGVVSAPIDASENGVIVTQGYVDGIDLSSGYTAGDVLWLGEDGAFTTTKPTAPEHLVFVGVVVRATSNGIIYVATQNGYELDELHDVSIVDKTSGDFLKYNGTLWVNDQINLGTDTVGSYVASLVAGTNITLSNNSGEGATPTVALSSTLNNISVSTSSTTTVPLTIKQITSQSASLVEFLDSSNNVMSKIDYAGTFWSQYSIVGSTSGYPSGTTFAVNSVGSSSVGIIAKGASSQTADLLQLQNSSGSILTRISSDGSFTTTGSLNVQEIREKVTDSSISTNVMTCDYTTGTIFYQASNPSANFTVNVTNLPTDDGNAITISIFVTQGSTGYIPNALQVAGSAQTIKWAGGTAPTPTSSSGKIDLFTFSLIRRGSAWTVLGSANLNY
jgi:hypothetical protein